MKNQGRMFAESLRYFFLRGIIVTALMTIIAIGCGGGGGGDGDADSDCRKIGYTYNTSGQVIDTVDMGECSCANYTPGTGPLTIVHCDIQYNKLGLITSECICQDTGTGGGGTGNDPNITVTDSVSPYNDLRIPFGEVTVGSSLNKTVTVTNDGDENLTIGTIAQANPLAVPFSILNDKCSWQTLAPGLDCTLTVCFSPSTIATFNDSFDIPSNDPDEDPVTVRVSGAADTTYACEDIAGNWSESYSVAVSMAVDGGPLAYLDTLTGPYSVSIEQHGCAVEWTISEPGNKFKRTGDVNGNIVNLSGENTDADALESELEKDPDISSVVFRENIHSGTGVISRNRINYSGSGTMRGSAFVYGSFVDFVISMEEDSTLTKKHTSRSREQQKEALDALTSINLANVVTKMLTDTPH